MSKVIKLLLLPYILWMAMFIVIPIILLIYFSFTDIHGHFSINNYQQIFSLSYLQMFGESVFFALLITILTLLVSYPAAYFLTYSSYQHILLILLIVPTWLNLLLKTYAFISIFSHDGIINQLMDFFHLPSLNILFTGTAFVIVATYIYIPFMILPIFNSLKDIPVNVIQASKDLGAGTWATVWRVLIPMSKKGIITGIQVTFIPSLSLFMITRLIAGNKVINVGTAIEEQFLVSQNYGLGSSIALTLIIFMIIVLLITQVLSKGSRKE
ncbi:ABC transporter permease [Staphylococcus sp. SQ8-PEA]|uniref:ABC transporter permease n=1 Tax=Staphylococcus marylandisciuri TaxID=2981529 RepID=A0ABT2QNU8_9STAP|nr:ABC transporter permease [Staphylococcus marylandisciuri]MCU5745650.1 ABC transporter permease [Staphylococcus marylandisciuri]